MANNIDMMDFAYFIGRSEILHWINSTLQLNLSKVEEACSGAVQGKIEVEGNTRVVELKELINGGLASLVDYW